MKPPKTLELLAHLKLHLLHVIYISEAITCCVSCDLNIMNIQAILISDVVSFSALNYPLKVNVKDHVNKHRNKHTMRSHPSTSSSTSSVQQSLLATETDDKKNSSETQKTYSCQSPPRSSLSQENTVGIIGGVSVLSTLIFLEKLVFRSSRGGGESVPFIVCSGFDQDQDQDQGQTGVVENLRHKRVFLEQGGARCIVMPCHLSHAWYGEISQGCTLPFLHLAESVAMQLKEARFKPLEAGSRVKIGLIATDATLMAGVYQDMLQNQAHLDSINEEARQKVALNPDKWVEFKLDETANVSHNTKLFRFTFDTDAKLGLDIASCILTRAPTGKDDDGKTKYVIRPYTPISDPDDKGYFDLMIKVYPEGKMSQHFAKLKPGDVVEVKGPIEKLRYTPNMKKHIGMIAGGTGVTPMLQVVEAILKNPDDNTQVSLLYANVSPDDILLKQKLDILEASHPNFKVFYTVDNPSKNWRGGIGYVSKDMVKKGLPAPGNDTLILVCGPPGMMEHISGGKAKDWSQGELTGILKEVGYTEEMVYKF